jgi:transposase
MEITEEQYERIKDALPVQRGNVRLSNLQVLNAVLYVAEQGCKWRGLPKRFGRVLAQPNVPVQRDSKTGRCLIPKCSNESLNSRFWRWKYLIELVS